MPRDSFTLTPEQVEAAKRNVPPTLFTGICAPWVMATARHYQLTPEQARAAIGNLTAQKPKGPARP